MRGSRFDSSYLELANDVFSRPFFRRVFELSCVLSAADGDDPPSSIRNDTILQLSVRCGFSVHNVTREERDWTWQFFVEQPVFYGGSYESKLERITVDGRQLSDEEIQSADDEQADDDSYRRYEKVFRIAPGGCLKVEIFAVLFKAARDDFIWRLTDPSDGLRFRLSFPACLTVYGDVIRQDYDFDANFVGTGPISCELNIDAPMLVENGVMVWWKLRDPSLTDAGESDSFPGPSDET